MMMQRYNFFAIIRNQKPVFFHLYGSEPGGMPKDFRNHDGLTREV